MLGRGRGGFSGLRRRLAAIGSGFVDAFLRDNRVLPPVLALLALLVFAWVVAGVFLGDSNDEQISNRANVAQSENSPAGSQSTAPEVENRNAESYAAYQSKDPFRQLLSSAGETTGATSETTTAENTTGGGATGGGGGQDSDGDGLSDKRESELGLDPFNPDTDGDGTLDGDERSAGGAGGGGRNATGGAGEGGGGLFNSGGNLPAP